MAAKRSSSDSDEEPPPKRKPYSKKPGQARNHWMLGLLESMKNPDMIMKEDDTCVIIKDGYPKARHHYLVLPKAEISSLRALNSTHVGLLKHMFTMGQKLVEDVQKGDRGVSFRMGYHAVPSMARLHMHVVSQDFDSPCLKNKKHWNSFTSEFFLDAKDVIKTLEEKGKVPVDKDRCEQLLKLPLKCHVCNKTLSNMPKLKSHITSH